MAARLADDLERLPEVPERHRRLNAEEPYRLALTCIGAKLANTRTRIARGAPHVPGRDYLGTPALLEDLMSVRDSLLECGGGAITVGRLERGIRTIAAFGLHLATLDVREHAAGKFVSHGIDSRGPVVERGDQLAPREIASTAEQNEIEAHEKTFLCLSAEQADVPVAMVLVPIRGTCTKATLHDGRKAIFLCRGGDSE